LNFSRVYNQKQNKGGLWIALIFIFVSSAPAQSEFPINDPRNPKCPCHKYQQQAEDEYKKLQAQNNSVNLINEIKLTDNKKLNSNNGNSSEHMNNNSLGNGVLFNPNHNGLSAEDLARINVSEGDDVLGKINYEPGELKVAYQKTGHSGSYYTTTHHSTTAHWKGKHKKHTASYKQLKKIFCVSGWDIWKRKRNTSKCYHWK
jgi:hypothetical protein